MTTPSRIGEALDVLNKGGKGYTAKQMLELAKALKKENAFSYARRVLALARTEEFAVKELALLIDQQYALCTYKDVDLPVVERLDTALSILKEGIAHLDKSKNSETLSLGGAIYKRKWETDGQRKNLELSWFYYRKAKDEAAFNDEGYAAINTAYVLDLLAQQEQLGTDDPILHQKSAQYIDEASAIRKEMIENLAEKTRKIQKPSWWACAALAEAHFGLAKYDEAKRWLKTGLEVNAVDDWELESTSRQLAQIAIIHDPKILENLERSGAWDTLNVLFPNSDATGALTTTFHGKVGLALSGGGFRASLYHIGVLAKLAEADVLRRVEILSCVSGGSIIGAYYYLMVKALLEEKADKDITKDNYIGIVKKISDSFLQGIQKNIRMRVLNNWLCNLRMFCSNDYSRTNRLGELYEEILYSNVIKTTNGEIWLNHLYIQPKDTGPNFKPKYDNWRRQAKVPMLILNATSLNTGHNWQFTASFMGEPPSSIQKIDGNYRMRRMYYKTDGDPESHRKIRLGYAVAASSCVPAMFEPLSLSTLYPDKIVGLVDGGVHDNQGVIGLMEQDCSVMLVSDASGQMGSVDNPPANEISVLLRTNNILMERVRNAQYQDLQNRYSQGRLKGFMFIHLKMGLNVQVIDWVNCEDPKEDDCRNQTLPLTEYNIKKEIQHLLADIRTDLDSFHDTEAFALMTSGYLMTATELPKYIPGAKSVPSDPSWRFLQMQDELKRMDTPKRTSKLLKASCEKLFKVWRLNRLLLIVGMSFLVGLLAFLIYLFWETLMLQMGKPVFTYGQVALSLAYLIAGLFVSGWILQILRLENTLRKWAIGIALITVGWLLANIHLVLFDKIYLVMGKRK